MCTHAVRLGVKTGLQGWNEWNMTVQRTNGVGGGPARGALSSCAPLPPSACAMRSVGRGEGGEPGAPRCDNGASGVERVEHDGATDQRA